MKKQNSQKICIYAFVLLFAGYFQFIPLTAQALTAQASTERQIHSVKTNLNSLNQTVRELQRANQELTRRAGDVIRKIDDLHRQNQQISVKIEQTRRARAYSAGHNFKSNYNKRYDRLDTDTLRTELQQMLDSTKQLWSVLADPGKLEPSLNALLGNVDRMKEENRSLRAELDGLRGNLPTVQEERQQEQAQRSKERGKSVIKWLTGETSKPPNLRINGRIKTYPVGKEGWRQYRKDKERKEMSGR